jgi:hypothetical protein
MSRFTITGRFANPQYNPELQIELNSAVPSLVQVVFHVRI